MEAQGIKQRHAAVPTTQQTIEPKSKSSATYNDENEHPAGEVVHGGPIQTLRLLGFVSYFLGCCCTYDVPR